MPLTTFHAWKRRTAPAVLSATLATLLAGCAFAPPQTPEQAVHQRAQARWQALLKRDFDKAWTYTTPKFRSEVQQGDYKIRFGEKPSWISADVVRVQCHAASCLARIHLTAHNIVPSFARAIPQISSYFDEAWVREDGQWWYEGPQTLPPEWLTETTGKKSEAPSDKASDPQPSGSQQSAHFGPKKISGITPALQHAPAQPAAPDQ